MEARGGGRRYAIHADLLVSGQTNPMSAGVALTYHSKTRAYPYDHMITTATTMATQNEPFGTTPLPTPVEVINLDDDTLNSAVLKIVFDPNQALESAQQPQSQQIALFEPPPCDDCLNGSRLDINQHFVVYAVKNGLIRVLHRHSALRTLLRGHEGQRITDIAFFQDGEFLGTVGSAATAPGRNNNNNNSTSSVIIWRVYERSPEIVTEKILEFPTSAFSISRIVWHPFNPNQFLMIRTTPLQSGVEEEDSLQVATLVETTRIATEPHKDYQHPVCKFHNDHAVVQGAIQLAGSASLTDLAWSGRDPRHVLTTHSNGEIILWDLKTVNSNSNQEGLVHPNAAVTVKEDEAVSRCLFLPHENTIRGAKESNTSYWTTCFCTATRNNACFTIWSPFSEHALPSKLQVISMAHPAPSYLLALCSDPTPTDASPPSSFLLLADRSEGSLFAFHLQSKWNEQPQSAKQALVMGCDYVVPFSTKYPIYSWSVVCSPTTDISEEELNEQGGLISDMKLFSYQSQVVQSLTLTSYMCLPPETSWTDATPGVTVLEDEQPRSSSAAPSQVLEDDKNIVYDEDYEVEDDNNNNSGDQPDDEDEYAFAPAASSLPPPIGFGGVDSSSTGTTTLGSTPSGGGATTPGILNNNAFANWLGAIAAKTSEYSNGGGGSSGAAIPELAAKPSPHHSLSPRERVPPPPPPPTPANALKMLSSPTSSSSIPTMPGIDDPVLVMSPPSQQPSSIFLSPVDILARNGTGAAVAAVAEKNMNAAGSEVAPESPSTGKKKGKAAKKDKSKPYSNAATGTITKAAPAGSNKTSNLVAPTPSSDGKISILKRDETALPAPVVTSPAVTAPPVASTSSAAPSLPIDFEDMLNKAMTAQAKKQQSFLVTEIQRAVRTEVETAVIPALSKAVQQSMDQSLLGPLKADLAKMKKSVHDNKGELIEAVSIGVEEPLRSAFASSMKEMLIPAFESVTTRMFSQISTTLATNLSSSNSSSSKMEELATSLSTIASSVEKLSLQMEEMRASIAMQASLSSERKPPGLVGASQVDKMQSIRDEIMQLAANHKYEEAFIKALSASTAEMAVFCCEQITIGDVLSNEKQVLSQPILLCLMQQLGAALISSTGTQKLQLEVRWLQEIALFLDPLDASIRQHVPTVLNELVTYVTKKMAGGDQALRRPLEVLLRVIRGMQMG